MVTQVADSYACESGEDLWVGRPAPDPTWLSAITPGTWGEFAGTGKNLQAVNPENDPAVNPDYPAVAPWRGNTGHASLIAAYNCVVQMGAKLGSAGVGGHGDHGANGIYLCNARHNDPAFVRTRNPAGSVGNTGTLNDGLDNTGIYFDGSPRSGHNYNLDCFIPGRGIFKPALAGMYIFGNDSRKTFFADVDAGTFHDTGLLIPARSAYQSGGSAYDHTRDRVLTLPGPDGNMCLFNNARNPSTNNWTSPSVYVPVWDYKHPVYIEEFDIYFVACGAFANDFFIVDATTFAITEPGLSGSFPSGFTFDGRAGVTWDSVDSHITMWNNATNRDKLATLTPSGNPKTDPWVRGTITPDVSNTIVPSVPPVAGLFGGFGFIQEFNGYWLLNGTTEPVRFFRKAA